MRRLLLVGLVFLVGACGEKEEETDAQIVAPPSSRDPFDGGTGTDTGGDTGGTTTDGETTTGEGTTGGGTTGGGDTTGGGTGMPTGAEKVVSLSVVTGPAAGGTETVIVTAGFDVPFTVTEPKIVFGLSEATIVEVIDSSVVRVKTPAGPAGLVSVSLVAGGQNAVLKDAFTYHEAAELTDVVKVSVPAAVEASGVPISVPITVEVLGNVKPAALIVDIIVDLTLMPLATPTALDGTLAASADKQLYINTKKNDTVRMLVIGKNRKAFGDGQIATLVYNLPPVAPGTVTPLTVKAQAVDGVGNPIPLVTGSGWLIVGKGNQ